MPWHVEENGGDCGGDEPWAVIQDDSGETASCHATEAEAEDAMAALYANEPDASSARAFRVVLCVEGVRFHEGGGWARQLTVGGGTWRNPPLPLYLQQEIPEMGGHAGGVAVGHIDQIERVDERRIVGAGMLDSAELGAAAERLIREQTLRFVSIDIGNFDAETEVLEVAEDGWPMAGIDHFETYEIISACALGQPALPQAVIWMADMDEPPEVSEPLPEVPDRLAEPAVVDVPGDDGVVILASGERAHVPQGAFDLPTEGPIADRLDEIVAGGVPILDMDDEGRVFGMIAPFGACHVGYPQGPEVCVTAPRSAAAYAHFHTTPFTVLCDDGCEEILSVGVITVGTEHADTKLSARGAAFHYENTGAVGAYVMAYETPDAIVFAGIVRPDLHDAQRAQLRGPVSGDWRFLGGGLELLATLRVNTPGFQAPRTHVASGMQTALVAAAHPVPGGRNGHGVTPRDLAGLDTRLRRLEGRIGELVYLTEDRREAAIDDLAHQIGR